jgi:hypothetical protein
MRKLHALYNWIFRRKEIHLALKSMNVDDDRMNMVVEHPEIAVIASELGEFFIKCGGVNVLEMKMFDPATIGIFVLTMQREGHPSFADINETMREALEKIHQHPENALRIAEITLKSLGYYPIRAESLKD